jgi:hypothetical protein
MEELRVDFSENYPRDIIYFRTTSQLDNSNICLISANFESRTIPAFSLQRHYFNLIYMLNLKQFKIEISE